MKTKCISWLSMFLLLTICCGYLNLVKASNGAALSIEPPTYQVAQGDIGNTFQINITVTNVTQLWSWKVRLNWNATVMNLTGSPEIKEGPFLKSGGATLFLWSPNQTAINSGYVPEISSTLISANGVNGSGVLATITFKSLTAGTSDVLLNETVMLEPGPQTVPISHTVTNGQVNVISEFQHLVMIMAMFSAASIAVLVRKHKVVANQ